MAGRMTISSASISLFYLLRTTLARSYGNNTLVGPSRKTILRMMIEMR
jgi:hypothetical protein